MGILRKRRKNQRRKRFRRKKGKELGFLRIGKKRGKN